ncbi:hypothetical protein [Ornithobacterium rhinotracheale]|uniref:hypothetical protein n=1 Tax=Ornithobacterium rhinotracheale TaxID=28251 RepID=UPI001FF13A02|nr:hypothetical protein [Ornithobacterium rhinotracheale]MCK0204177.1 hypothetical protein [Ornithobacterium rhinotracheale]
MKKQLLFLGMLLSGTGAFAQINTQGEISASIDEQNPFLDASGYNAVGNSIAKGVYFPSTDLTTWEFKLDMIDPTKFSSYFDGMVVYNSGTGKTLADTSKGGKQVEVTPGFYYFKNPGQSFPVGSVANGQWVRLGAEVVAGNTTLGTLPKYSTADRDKLTGVAEGTIIYNTTTKKVEVYNGTSWDTVSGGATTNTGGGSTPGGSIDPGTGVTPPGGSGTDPGSGTGGQPGNGTIIPPLSGGSGNPSPSAGTGSQGGGLGRATLASEQVIYVESVQASGNYPGYQGVVDNSSNKITVSIPYTNGNAGSYDAVSWKVVTLDGAGESGSKKRITLNISKGTMSPSGGNITGTLVVDGDGTFLPKKQPVPVKKGIYEQDFAIFKIKLGTKDFTLKLKARGGVPDAQFNKQTNGKYEHQFVYLPVKDKSGRTWLNHNLGADYTNFNHQKFAPAKVPESYDDYHAYGSLPQLGTPMDGSELIKWTGPNEFTPVYPVGEWYSEVPTSTSQQVNPCPEGYSIPYYGYFSYSYIGSNFEQAYNGDLHLTVSPGRYYRDQEVGNKLSQKGRYWLKYYSSPSGNLLETNYYYARYGYIGSSLSYTSTSNGAREVAKFGLSVRCIKN